MARPRTTYDQRTVSEPEQRKFFPIEPDQRRHQQQRTDFTHAGDDTHATERLEDPVRRFEILKSTPLGLVAPQDVHFSVVELEHEVSETEFSWEIPTSSVEEPVFRTSLLRWWKQKYMLPPSFEMFPGGAHRQARQEVSRGRGVINTDGTNGLSTSSSTGDQGTHPRSNIGPGDSKDEKTYPLAEIKYRGWQGVTGMSIALTLYNITPSMHHEFSHSLKDDSHASRDIRTRYKITRTGFKREYILHPNTYKWRSPSIMEKRHILTTSTIDDSTSTPGHGNLILEDGHFNIVAVYRQRRDHDILGNLTVCTSHLLGTNSEDEAPAGKLTLEAVVASCLAVVMYERVAWQNLLGR